MELGSRLASATIQLTLANAAVRVLSVVTMPLLTRLLSPEAYGAASLVGTVIALIAVLALAGMDMSYARAFHAARPPTGDAVEAFAWKFTLAAGLGAGLLGAVAWWVIFADVFSLPRYLAVLLGFGILLSNASTMAQTRARLRNQYRLMSIAIVAAGIGGVVVSILIATYWRNDELPLVLSILIGYLIPIVILGTPAPAMLADNRRMTGREQVDVLKIGLAGIVTAPMFWVLSSLDRWFLGYYEDSASVGIYSIGYSVAIMGMMVNNALQAVWLPEAAREYERDPEAARVVLGGLAERLVAALAIVWLAVAAGGGDAVRLLADQRFHQAAAVVPYIAAGVFFYGVLHLANAGLLLRKRLQLAAWWWLAGAVVCLLLNWWLVPIAGRVGAAITQAMGFGLVAAGIGYSSQRVFPVKIRGLRLTLIVFAVAALGILMIPPWADVPWKSLVAKLPIGLLAASAVYWLVAPLSAKAMVIRAFQVGSRKG